MKYRLLPLLAVLAMLAAGWSADSWAEPRTLDALCTNLPFEEGEMARFVARVGFLKVGEGTAIVRKMKAPPSEVPLSSPPTDLPLWHVAGRLITTKPIALFYRANDSIAMWMQPVTFSPHRREVRIDETNERATWRVLYDPGDGVAHFWRDRTSYPKKPHRVRVTERRDALARGSFEPISLFFYLRCVGATVGDEFEVPVHEGGKNLTAKIRIEKIETIKTPLGKREALRARIDVFLDGKKENKRPFRAWVSNDEHRIPLRFVVDLPFANLKGVVVGYRNDFEGEIEGTLDPDFVDGSSDD